MQVNKNNKKLVLNKLFAPKPEKFPAAPEDFRWGPEDFRKKAVFPENFRQIRKIYGRQKTHSNMTIFKKERLFPRAMSTPTLGDLLAAEKEEKATAASAGKRRALEAELERLDDWFSSRLPENVIVQFHDDTPAFRYLVKKGILSYEEVEAYKARIAQFEKDHFGRGGEYYRRGHQWNGRVMIGGAVAIALAGTAGLDALGNISDERNMALKMIMYCGTFAVSLMVSGMVALASRLSTDEYVHRRFEDHSSFHTDDSGKLAADVRELRRTNNALREKLLAVPLEKPEGSFLRNMRARGEYSGKVDYLRDAVEDLGGINLQLAGFFSVRDMYLEKRTRVLSDLSALPPPPTQSYAPASTPA